jgi:hypothetical protein
VKRKDNAPDSTPAKRPSRLPIRWEDVPHQALWQRVLDTVAYGSRARSSEESIGYVLKRRLPKLDPNDHSRYVELECRRIVETLRVVRDEYRAYLEGEGCKPIAEMYWVVFRFAVIRYAVKVLRTTAGAYVVDSRVQKEHWRKLYAYSFDVILPIAEGLGEWLRPPVGDNWAESVQETMDGLITEETFQLDMTGGPLGIEGQVSLGLERPSVEFQRRQATLMESIKLRQELWVICKPWTEGLATLFDAAQEELFAQKAALTRDGRQSQARFLSLSDFERIAYTHLVDIRERNVNSRGFGHKDWLSLFRELDKRRVALDGELSGKAGQVLDKVRRKGHQVKNWEECYATRVSISLIDGKTYSLRRELTHAVHNAAKRAAYQLEKICKS